MHCANCSKNFPAKESKCPDCEAWLVPGKIKKASQVSKLTVPRVTPEPTPALNGAAAGKPSSSWESWDAPSEEAWGTSDTPWKPEESSTTVSANEPEPTPKVWGEMEDGQYGWVEETLVPQEPNKADRGWLTDEDGALSSTKVSESPPDESTTDDWVEGIWDAESMDHYSEEEEDQYSRRHEPIESPSLTGFFVVTLVVLLLGGYLWSRPSVEADSAEAQRQKQVAQDLAQGRAYFEAAQLKYRDGEGDSEWASSQLRAATKTLVKGEAPKSELDAAYILLAKASFDADQLLISRDLWLQLGENIPELKAEANGMVSLADKALVARGEKLLKKAYQELKQKRDNASRASAEQALDLFLDFGGTDQQVGRGYAALARADLHAGVMVNAFRFFQEAKKYDKQGNYDAQIGKLRRLGLGSGAAPAPKVKVHRDNRSQKVTSHRPSLGPGNTVPTANPGVHRPSQPKPKPAAQTSVKAPTGMKEIPSYKKNKERRKKQNSSKDNVFVNYRDNTRR